MVLKSGTCEKKTFAVLGNGRQGTAAAYDLAKFGMNYPHLKQGASCLVFHNNWGYKCVGYVIFSFSLLERLITCMAFYSAVFLL